MDYRKKPVVIQAVQWTNDEDGRDLLAIHALSAGGYGRKVTFAGDGTAALVIQTLEGAMRCDVSDWIIKGVKGELYPCKPDIFEATYEPVGPEGA